MAFPYIHPGSDRITRGEASVLCNVDGDIELNPASGRSVIFPGSVTINFGDSDKLQFGDDNDYWFEYDSSNTQFELNSTDVDGGGSDGLIFHVPDGGDAIAFAGDVGIGGVSPSVNLHVREDQAALTAIRIDNSDVSGSMALDFYDGSNQRGEVHYDTAAAKLTIGTFIATGDIELRTANDTLAVTVDENQDMTVAGDLTVSGAGPHAIGRSTINYGQWAQGGSFTSGGGASEAIAAYFLTSLTGANGDTGLLANVKVNGTITTQGNSETITDVSSLHVLEPNITVGTGDTITNASTLKVLAAPTEGTNNYALWVDDGTTRLDGDVHVEQGQNLDLSGGNGNRTITGDPSGSEGLRFGSVNEMTFIVDTDDNSSGDGFHWYHGATTAASATELMVLTDSGLLGINETSNANMTTGLTINQGAADDQAIALKSSDVATGLTTATISQDVETDDYLSLSKVSATRGGVLQQVMTESNLANGYFLEVYGGTPTTTDTTGSVGAANFFVAEHDGSNGLNNMAADSNGFAWGEIDSGGNRVTRMLLKADDGELHLGNTTLVALDAEDDVQAVRTLQKIRTGGEGIRESRFDRPTYNYDALHEMGVVGERDGNGEFLIRVQPYLNLHDGAIWQLYCGQQETKNRIAALEDENRALRQQVTALLN